MDFIGGAPPYTVHYRSYRHDEQPRTYTKSNIYKTQEEIVVRPDRPGRYIFVRERHSMLLLSRKVHWDRLEIHRNRTVFRTRIMWTFRYRYLGSSRRYILRPNSTWITHIAGDILKRTSGLVRPIKPTSSSL